MRLRLLIAVAICTSGCATSAFKIPLWDVQQSTTTPTSVEAYLLSHVAVYDKMLDELETGKGLLEFPIIPASIVGTTAVALGAGTNWPSALGGGAAGLAASSAYISPRERLGLVVQARAATVCIRREYVEQLQLLKATGLLAPAVPAPLGATIEYDARGAAITAQAREAGTTTPVAAVVTNELLLAATQGRQPLVPTSAADSLPLISDQIAGVGSIAVAGEDEVVTRLKTHLAALGAAPNYSTIVSDLRTRFEQAQAKADATTGGAHLNFAGGNDQAASEIVKKISEYSARIAECTAKIAA